ncbi:MAG: ribosome silencing factor [Endomicrobiia bacterium]
MTKKQVDTKKKKKIVKLPSLNLAKIIAKLSSDKKAEDIVILDVRKVSSFCDFFVIMTGNVEVHIESLKEHIITSLKRNYNIYPHHVEGEEYNRWVVIDYISVVVHIMNPELREFYALERIWAKGKKVSYDKKSKKNI